MKVVINAIMAMDGTIIQSHHRHDYKEHTCEIEGDTYHCSVDGGLDYLKRSGTFTEMSLYDNSPFEIIRLFLCRGGRGKDLKQPLKYIPLCAINDNWLDNLINYEKENRPNNPMLSFYLLEKKHRLKYKIKIDETF